MYMYLQDILNKLENWKIKLSFTFLEIKTEYISFSKNKNY